MLGRLLADVEGWLGAVRGLPAPWRRPARLPLRWEPPRLTRECEWMRATAALRGAIAAFARVKDLHAAAARQIDAADYALQHLLEELGTVMPPVPADGAALRALLAGAARPVALDEALAA